MICLALVFPLVLWPLWYITAKYLGDPSYFPVWDIPECHGRKCGGKLVLYTVGFLFLLLPVWIKLPSVAFGVAELFWRVLAMLYWSFDSRPDFAIGPHGIYGVSRFKYHHVGWPQVGGIHLVKNIQTLTTMKHLKIYTKQKTTPASLFPTGRKVNVTFAIAPIHGIEIEAVLRDIEKFAPGKKVINIDVDSRPKWLR
jgi:hypothetical protein